MYSSLLNYAKHIVLVFNNLNMTNNISTEEADHSMGLMGGVEDAAGAGGHSSGLVGGDSSSVASFPRLRYGFVSPRLRDRGG